jgi:hypothetical protein
MIVIQRESMAQNMCGKKGLLVCIYYYSLPMEESATMYGLDDAPKLTP